MLGGIPTNKKRQMFYNNMTQKEQNDFMLKMRKLNLQSKSEVMCGLMKTFTEGLLAYVLIGQDGKFYDITTSIEHANNMSKRGYSVNVIKIEIPIK